MHTSSLIRMRWFVKTYLLRSENAGTKMSVLDIGSCDVNGSYRQFFPASLFDYTGLDMEAGANVDIVPVNTYSWSEIPDEVYDVIISGQVLEHAEFFWITMSEMVRVLKRGGILCLIVPRTHGRHRFPVDCYRFDTDGVIALAKYANLEILHASCDKAPPGASDDWYATDGEDTMLVAKKPMKWKGLIDPKEYRFSQNDLEKLLTGFVPKSRNIKKNRSETATVQNQEKTKPQNYGQTQNQDIKQTPVQREGYYDTCQLSLIALITHKEHDPICILEIGCAGGATLHKITETWPRSYVKGVELIPEIADIARNRGLDILCCDVEETDLPYEKESFDYILLGDVIEHLRYPKEAMLKLYSLLKQGGCFICSIPNIQHYSILNDLMKGKFEYVDAGILDRTHLRFFTMYSVRQLFLQINTNIECLFGITWLQGSISLTDIINEETESQKLYEFQQFLLRARKG